jgi:hypothetical protein
MITKLHLLVCCLGLSLLSAALAPASPVTMPTFKPVAGQQFVEIDLDQALLKFAGHFAAAKDEGLRDIIQNLQRVRVNVVGLNAVSRDTIAAEFAAWHESLDAAGWRSWVEVREASGSDVSVRAKQDANGVVEGFVLTVLDGAQAVVINVTCRIDFDQLARVGEALGIVQLANLSKLPRS